MSKSKIARVRPHRRSLIERRGRPGKILVSGVPKFLVKLVGWRRLKPALTERAPRYRHD